MAKGISGCGIEILVCEERLYCGHCGACRRSKLAERFNRQPAGSITRVVEEFDQRRDDYVWLNVQVAQGVSRALAIEVVRVLKVLKEYRDGGSCVGPEVRNRDRRLGRNPEVLAPV